MASTRQEELRDLTPHERAVKCYEDNAGTFSPYWDAMSREDAFLEGDRYERDHGLENRDRRLAQIRGQETQDTIRDFVSEATARPRSVEAKPVDQDFDADLAEFEVALVEKELGDPWKGFEDRYVEAVQTCREMRLGVVWMDWEPGFGPYGGEMFYRNIDPRRIMWDPGYDPHHPLCGWVWYSLRLDVDQVRKDYGIDWLEPDHHYWDRDRRREDVPLIRTWEGHELKPRSSVRDNKAEIWFLWYKNDPTTKTRERESDLEKGMRYMACLGGCGYRSSTQGELGAQGKGQELPDMLEGACPECGGDLHRVDALAQEEQVLEYHRGKRLTIIAPFSPNPKKEHIYDGPWPIKRARSFPGLFLFAYLKPGKPIGGSDVKLMWDQQLASDQLRTMAIQRVFEHRNYWELPWVGITDGRNRRFNFRDDQRNVMFRDASKGTQGDLSVNVHHGTGLDASGWNLAFNATQQALLNYRPSLDLGLTPETSKNIPVGTIEQLTRQGKISIEEFKRRANLALSKFYGVVSDYIHATYTPKRLLRLNIDGADLALRVWGQDMPNYDFVIEETPPFTGLDKARAQAFQAVMQVATNPAMLPFLEEFADFNNIPRSVVRRVQRKVEKQMQQQQAQMEQMQLSGGMGGPAGGPPPGLEEGIAALGVGPEAEQQGVTQ